MCPSLIGDQYLLVGALSGGIECGVTGLPDLYTSFLYGAADWAYSILEEFPEPPADEQFLKISGLRENRFNSNLLGSSQTLLSRNFHGKPAKSNFDANVKDFQQTYVIGNLQGRSLLPFTNSQPTVNNKIEAAPDKEPETSTYKTHTTLIPPTVVTPVPYPVTNVPLQQEKPLKPSNQDAENSNSLTRSTNNSTSSNSKSPVIVRASSVDTDSSMFRPFQHQARSASLESESVLVSSASGYRPTGSPSPRFVSPSYSSIVQFRPRRVISPDHFSVSEEEGEDEGFCIGYENFGSGGVSGMP